MSLAGAVRASAPGSPELGALKAIRTSQLERLRLQRLKRFSKKHGDPPSDVTSLREFWNAAMNEPVPIEAEVDEIRLVPPTLRKRGKNTVPQLNHVIWHLYVVLLPFYVARPRLRDDDISVAKEPDSDRLKVKAHRRHAMFPRDLIVDIADLLDGEVGAPDAPVTTAYVKRAIQELLERMPELRHQPPKAPRLR
ncbi:MAG: hypothetical protein JST54_27940 [Deltaproteobacteria bacterium]|nr:hypothetical protein [Deltaproteobacteria bacterium]